MTITQLCVGIVALIVILMVTAFISAIETFATGTDWSDVGPIIAWLISAIGFAGCLTIVLFQNHIL